MGRETRGLWRRMEKDAEERAANLAAARVRVPHGTAAELAGALRRAVADAQRHGVILSKATAEGIAEELERLHEVEQDAARYAALAASLRVRERSRQSDSRGALNRSSAPDPPA